MLAGTFEASNTTGNIYSTYTEVTTATGTVTSVSPSKYIREKNDFEQRPLVRLYSIYYPGEWYPTNTKGNPTGEGEGYSWPAGFPLRIAEVRGDYISDLNYKVSMGGVEYSPYPINSGPINVDSSGKIGELSITLSNWDNVITSYIEDPLLVGNNEANAISAVVNGETVYNIDPKTVPTNTSGNPYGLHYDSAYAQNRGGINLAYDYDSAIAVKGTWKALKQDTRDLLGAVVEIKTTFANFLDVWPEYSTVSSSVVGTTVPVITTLPYRVGDIICNSTSTSATTYTISQVNESNLVVTSATGLSTAFPVSGRVFIVNSERDPDNYTIDKFKIDGMSSSDERSTTFGLVNWLQYFKLQLPKRRYYKNTCPWIYRGPECRYPSNASDTPKPLIPGSNTLLSTGELLPDGLQANGFFTINNVATSDPLQDICAKTFTACRLRNNQVHFGGFPATGRNMPK